MKLRKLRPGDIVRAKTDGHVSGVVIAKGQLGTVSVVSDRLRSKYLVTVVFDDAPLPMSAADLDLAQ